MPGDSISRAVNLINDGNSALGSVTVNSALTSAANILTTDAVERPSAHHQGLLGRLDAGRHPDGTDLQLHRHRAHRADRQGRQQRAADQPGQPRTGGVDNLVFTIALPTPADNTFQNKSATLALTFTGVQRTAAAR